MALFSRHQLVFSFLLTSNIMKAKGSFPDAVSGVDAITDPEWQTFLQGPVLANMLDEETLLQHDGSYFLLVREPSSRQTWNKRMLSQKIFIPFFYNDCNIINIIII